jgi:hypothetical protein
MPRPSRCIPTAQRLGRSHSHFRHCAGQLNPCPSGRNPRHPGHPVRCIGARPTMNYSGTIFPKTIKCNVRRYSAATSPPHAMSGKSIHTRLGCRRLYLPEQLNNAIVTLLFYTTRTAKRIQMAWITQ